MNVKQIRKYCKLSQESKTLLKTAMEKLNLSARAYDRILNFIHIYILHIKLYKTMC
jgi:predicted ATPase with chaperone activity